MREMTNELFQVEPPPTGEIEDAVREAFDDLDAKGVLGPIEKAKRAALTKAAAALDRSLNGAERRDLQRPEKRPGIAR